jgi:hypothetical protein
LAIQRNARGKAQAQNQGTRGHDGERSVVAGPANAVKLFEHGTRLLKEGNLPMPRRISKVRSRSM